MSSPVLLFFSFSGSEIALILFVALILFGGDKFPEIARGLGKGIREFKDMSDGVKREIHAQINNYDLDVDRNTSKTNIVDTTERGQQAETPQHFEEHETHDITVAPNHDVSPHHDDTHDVSVLPHHSATPQETGTAANTDVPVAERPAMPKPDLTPPPNTISHQSY